MWKVFACLAFLAVVAAKDSYVVLTPTSFRPGVPLNISVNILKDVGDVSVTAALVNSGSDETVATATGTVAHGMPGTLRMQVPGDLRSGSYKVKVDGMGTSMKFSNETSIDYEAKNMSIFIQTDKAMYKPGQIVNFRTFAILPNMSVYTGEFNVSIYDANTNKIKQWMKLKDVSGVVTNFLKLDTQPVLGDWRIRVSAHGRTFEKTFTVAHYVLPKFEVSVELPSFQLTSEATIDGKVKATYTYGKPVEGKVSLRVTLTPWYTYRSHERPEIMQTFTIDGEASFSIPLDHIKSAQSNLEGYALLVEANVTESLNSITLGGNSSVDMYDNAVKLEFLSSNPETFKPGLDYIAYLRVTQQDGTAIQGTRRDLTVDIRCTYEEETLTTPDYYFSPRTHSYNLPELTLAVPDESIVPIQVPVPDNSSDIYIEAHYGKVQASLSLSKSYSPSDSYMQMSLKSTNLRANEVAMIDIKSTETIGEAVYQVMSRGSVADTGSFTGNSFSFVVTPEMAPNARVITYYVRADGEIVTDSISFDVDGAFQNEVTVSFDKAKVQPGENISVTVTADPQSFVNLLAVDQSVLLLKSGNDVTQSQVIDELKSYDTIAPHVDPYFGGGIMPMDVAARKKRMIWWPYPVYYGGSDAFTVFENSGVQVMTDALVYHKVKRPIYYYMMKGEVMDGNMAMPGAAPVPAAAQTAAVSSNSMKEVGRVRSVFPETWLWTNSSTGDDGSVTISTQMPDTITSWIASAFAVNTETGLGIAASTAKVEAFKPFFVSLNLPYSVVRGEQLALQANVFNYMNQDLDVLVILKASNDFRNIVVDSMGVTNYVSEEQNTTITVPAGEAKSVYFPIVPAALGKIPLTVTAQSALAADGVKRQLLVEAEGVPKEYSNPILIDLKDTSEFNETVMLSLPDGVVAGSERLVVTAIGDLMGPTVNGLDKLLRMPTGCGEQTMIGLAPDVFVTNYLTATNQLTGEIEEKAINYMESGYQRELTYQHTDGSFSAFGDRDDSGSMWLTAFVAKTFHQAKKQIFIDDETLIRALNWVVNHQNDDGSFPEPGRVIHKDMQGQAASGVGLTSFVLVALLENNDLGGEAQQRINKAAGKAVAYLENQLPTIDDDYVLSLTSYALSLANSQQATTAFTMLMDDVIAKDGTMHWHKDQSTTSTSHWQPSRTQANPIDIEMTAYALLVQAVNGDFAGGMPIMKWVTSQRNANGGFSSTQDTVVALQALSDFAAMAYSDTFDIQATVTADTFIHTFTINKQNALVLQSVVLPSIPSEVVVTATGHGMALVDIVLSFNVEQEIEEVSFQVDVTMVKETLEYLSIETCSTWLQSGSSGMAIQEIGIPTGFEADLESIADVKQIKRTELEDRKVILYFDEIGTTPICLTLDVYRTGMVAKSQPVAVRVYDYYQPSNQVTAFYQSHILRDTDICDVCAECGCPARGAK